MRNNLRGLLMGAFLAMLCLGLAETAAAQRWRLLGTRNVGDRVDRDTIVVTAMKGDFRRIKLSVRRTAVRFYKVTIHYATGGSQIVQMRNLVPAGGETRAIDLRGRDRVIRSVEFWYEARSLGRKSARIYLYGWG